MQDIEYMKLAYDKAKEAKQKDEVPVGCVIVKGDEILATFHNEKEERQDATAHAEMLCIKKAQEELKTWHLEECTMYVTLEPCLMCTGAIINSRISKVYFATRDPKGGALVSNINIKDIKGLNHYPQIEEGLLQAESSQILKDYFKDKRIKKS